MKKAPAEQPRERTPENIAAGKRLEELRVALGFKTQKAFREWLQVKEESTYRKWKDGDNGIPRHIQSFLKAEKGIPSDWLMHGDKAALGNLYSLIYPNKKS